VATLKHRDVSSQKPFADTTKEPQEIATARPNAFHRVIVDFANAITIIITRPFALSWRMADSPVDTTSGCELPISRPLIGVDDRIIAGVGQEQWLKRGAVAVVAEAQPDLPTATPHNPDNRWAITSPGSVTTRLVGPATWRISHISVFAPFLASVLIEFIGFGHWVGEWCGRGKNARPPVCVSRAAVRADVCD
jgi:hypothetical protein